MSHEIQGSGEWQQDLFHAGELLSLCPHPGSSGLEQPPNTQRQHSQHPGTARGHLQGHRHPKGAAGEAPTCRKPLLDEGEAVPGAHELDVAAGQGAALAGELHGQRGWAARPLRQLEPRQQRPHTCNWNPKGDPDEHGGALGASQRRHGQWDAQSAAGRDPGAGQRQTPLILPAGFGFSHTPAMGTAFHMENLLWEPAILPTGMRGGPQPSNRGEQRPWQTTTSQPGV